MLTNHSVAKGQKKSICFTYDGARQLMRVIMGKVDLLRHLITIISGVKVVIIWGNIV